MEELVKISKIMSDINRLNILALILREKELCVCEICDTLELSQPLVSRHLRQMKYAKILDSVKEKKWVVYFLNKNKNDILNCFIKEINKLSPSLKKLISCSRE